MGALVAGLAACGGEVASSSNSSPKPTTASSESEGFQPVPCLDAESTITDLSSVGAELGFDELIYVLGFPSSPSNADNGVRFSAIASTKSACVDEACQSYVIRAIREALATAANPDATGTTQEELRVWTLANDRGALGKVRVLVGRRGDAFSSVTTTADLRTFTGPLDSPWKAHLFVLTSDELYDVRCRAHSRGGAQQTFVRAGRSSEILEVRPAQTALRRPNRSASCCASTRRAHIRATSARPCGRARRTAIEGSGLA